MANYELYLGGPASANVNRAMFPAPTFGASTQPFPVMRPAAHKGPKLFSLNRTLDFTNDTALVDFVARQEASTPIVATDTLGVLVVPQDTLMLGVFYEVERVSSATSTVVTPAFRGDSTNTLPAITVSALSKGFAAPTDAAWTTTFTPLDTGVCYVPAPLMLQLTLTTFPTEKFGDLRLNIGVLLADLNSGEY